MSEPQIALLLERAAHVVGTHAKAAIGLDNVTVDHWRVLRQLAFASGSSMGTLAETLQMNPPTATKLIDRMVAQSLVHRGADPDDSRRVLVFATARGLAMLEKLGDSLESHQRELLNLLGERRAKQLVRLLADLVDCLESPSVAEGLRP